MRDRESTGSKMNTLSATVTIENCFVKLGPRDYSLPSEHAKIIKIAEISLRNGTFLEYNRIKFDSGKIKNETPKKAINI